MANQIYPTLWARLMANCRVTDSGCWEWTGARSSTAGRYPQMSHRVDGKHKTVRVHRFITELVLSRKLDSDKETIEHRCDNTACICPNDFLLATNEDNSKSMQWRRWAKSTDDGTKMKPLWPANDENWPPLFGLRYWHPDEPIPF